MTSTTSQIYESFIPVYDAVPEKWEDARPFIVEMLKKITEGTNVREIGFLLEEQLLTGKQFIPVQTDPLQYREVFRMVVDCSPLVAGPNNFAHGINVDANFTLIDLWVSATNSLALTSQVITDSNVTLDATDVNINSPSAFDRAFAFIEYVLES